MPDQLAMSPDARRPRSHAWWNAVNAWLLLLPAAVLLIAFTHFPILATIRHSFFITRRDGAEREPEIVDQRSPENRIGGHCMVALKADEGLGAVAARDEEGMPDRRQNRKVRERNQ